MHQGVGECSRVVWPFCVLAVIQRQGIGDEAGWSDLSVFMRFACVRELAGVVPIFGYQWRGQWGVGTVRWDGGDWLYAYRFQFQVLVRI